MKSLFLEKKRSLCLGAALAAAWVPFAAEPAPAEAAYSSEDTAGVNRLDFLENRRRTERENQLTDAQKRVQQEAAEMQQHLRYPVDPKKPAPTSFDGDELMYDQVTGAFTAKGHVKVVQADAHAFETADGARGNVKEQQIELPGQAHIVQMTPGTFQADLNGYQTFYDYGKKTGTMAKAQGKVGRYYVSGKRFEFYPDHYEVYDATETRCSAQHPDYLVKAAHIEYYPDKVTVYHDAKFVIKGNVIAKKHLHIVKAGEEGHQTDWIPRVGYNKDDGAYLREKLHRPLAKNIEWAFEGKLMQKNDRGGRGHGDIVWTTPGAGSYRLTYGYFEDGNQNWIKRRPEFGWDYSHLIRGTQWSYGLGWSIGRWQSQKTGIESNHSVYSFGLSREPLYVSERTFLTLKGGYRITKESYDDSTIRGVWGDGALIHEFDDRFAGYVAYAFNKETNRNSVFDFDLDDYNQKVQAGLSWRATPRDRFLAACEWDAQFGEMHDVDYYWFHDMHCAQAIVRYRSKQNSWHVSWQFAPW